MLKTSVPADMAYLTEALEVIENALAQYKVPKKRFIRVRLVTEEMCVKLMEAAPKDGRLNITVRYSSGSATVILSAEGEELSKDEIGIDFADSGMDDELENSIRGMLLDAFADDFSYVHHDNKNTVKISVGSKKQVFMFRTLLAFFSALLVSVLIDLLCPTAFKVGLINNLLMPMQTVFLNLLELVTAPAVFFSILTFAAKYTTMSNVGKIGWRIIVSCICSTVIATAIGILLFQPFKHNIQPLEGLLIPYNAPMVKTENSEWLINKIVNIVPSNIIEPFLNTDALQLLFAALLGGIALGKAGSYSRELRGIADALNKFFSCCVELISYAIPPLAFFATVLMYVDFGGSSLFLYAKLFGIVMLGFFVMLFLYLLAVAVRTGLNPFTFVKKCGEHLAKSFLDASEITNVPETMRFCEHKLGISPKVHSFAVPFGAIANMDGSCIYMSIAALFLAKLCGVDLNGTALIPFAAVVILLSVGSAITPGSVILALAILLNQTGGSLMILSFLLAFNAVLEVIIAVCNLAGTVTITLVAANSEKLLNKEIYRA